MLDGTIFQQPPFLALGAHTLLTQFHAALSPRGGFEDMFAEGEKKSAEQDHVPSRKGTPVAPPPKIGSAGVTPHSATQEKSDPLEQAGDDLGEPGEAEEA